MSQEPQEEDSELKICILGYSQDQQPRGREGSCTGQREKLNHSMMATKTSDHPVGNSTADIVLLNYLEFGQLGWMDLYTLCRLVIDVGCS